jgi:hypothetical protein
MQGNAHFPAPTVPIATLLAHTAEVEQAQVVAQGGVHGAAAERDAKLLIAKGDLEQLRTYVETVASGYGEEAEAVVTSSGMTVKRSAGPRKPLFAVKQGPVSGSAILVVRHPGVVTNFYWQYSTDGAQWTSAPDTVVARRDLEGLTPGVRYFFRQRTNTRKGTGDWSDPIAFMVV